MIEDNPYQSQLTTAFVDPRQRTWNSGADSVLAHGGLLRRKVIVNRPIEVTIEYFARGLRDRIIVDGKTVVSKLPILWLHQQFDFEIPYRGGTLPAVLSLKTGRRSLRLASFQITINGVVVYHEQNGQQKC